MEDLGAYKHRLRADRPREAARRTYLSLGLGELAAALVFGLVAVSFSRSPARSADESVALWWALVPLLVILLQAGSYWLLARAWVGHRAMPRSLARAYRVGRIVDPLILAAGLGGVIAHLPAGRLSVLVLGVWLFGLIEYLNYFVARLAYPIRGWLRAVTRWRRPQLVRDIDGSS